MKRRSGLSLAGVVSIFAMAAWGAPTQAPVADGGARWQRSTASDSVEVYTRAFAGSAYPQVRASGTVCATLPQLVEFVEDVGRFDSWIPDTDEARLLARPSRQEQIYYIRTSMPWPMQRRDMIYRLTESAAAPDGGEISVVLEGAPDYLPAYPGVVRMAGVTGRWTFRQAQGRTAIDLVMHIEPGGRVPSWLANRRIVGTPTRMIENLQRQFAPFCAAP